MNVVAEQILSLAKQLLPQGRAFSVPPQREGTGSIITDEFGYYITDEDGELLVTEDWSEGFGGWLERFFKSFGGDGGNRTGTLERCYTDARSILDHILPLPGNKGFTDGTMDAADNDCQDYEELLGLVQWGVTGPATPTRLQRMAIIATKMAYPGTDAPRQAREYIEDMLHAAGFTQLFVYENLSNLSPAAILGIPVGHSYYGSIDYGQADYGEDWGTVGISIIANSVDPAIDAMFTFPAGNYHGSFIIAGATISTFATVPAIQQTQLRQLILNLKPAHMAGFLFINYT